MRIKLSILNFVRVKTKGVFRKEHSAEIALYETARKFLKEKSGNIKLPSMKLLKGKTKRRIVKTEKRQPKSSINIIEIIKRIEYGSF